MRSSMSPPKPPPDLSAIRRWFGALILIKLALFAIVVALALRQFG